MNHCIVLTWAYKWKFSRRVVIKMAFPFLGKSHRNSFVCSSSLSLCHSSYSLHIFFSSNFSLPFFHSSFLLFLYFSLPFHLIPLIGALSEIILWLTNSHWLTHFLYFISTLFGIINWQALKSNLDLFPLSPSLFFLSSFPSLLSLHPQIEKVMLTYP